VVFYIPQALGLSIVSHPVQDEEDHDNSASPFFSFFWDDLPADLAFPAFSTMFGLT
jgi:hypothetical protein